MTDALCVRNTCDATSPSYHYLFLDIIIQAWTFSKNSLLLLITIMASTQISGSTLSLHGAPNKTDHEQNEPNPSKTGILVKLNDQVIRDLQKCAQGGKAVQLLGGKTPVCP
jgi:hypothetical protein